MMPLDLPNPAAIHWDLPLGTITPLIASASPYENVSTGALIRQLGNVYLEKIKHDVADPRGYLPFPQIDELKGEIEKRSLTSDLRSKYDALNNIIKNFSDQRSSYIQQYDAYKEEYDKFKRRGFYSRMLYYQQLMQKVMIDFSNMATSSRNEITNIIRTLPLSSLMIEQTICFAIQPASRG